MRLATFALMGAVAASSLGLGSGAQAQGYRYPGYVRVGQPLPIRIKPRSWLDAGNVTEPGNGSIRNPATDPQLIAASNILLPPYGPSDRYGAGVLPDPITNGPFPGARGGTIRNVDLSFVDAIDPTSYVARTGMNPYR